MNALLLELLQFLLPVATAPLLTGLVRMVKARLHGRRGPPPWQPYRDLLRLLRKESLVAHNASWIFRAAPYVVFLFTWLAAALVPLFTTHLLTRSIADLIGLIALLGSARFMLALAGMDIGTSFGGIGSSREMMISTLTEPSLLMVIFSLSLITGTTSITGITHAILADPTQFGIPLLLAVTALTIVAIAETGRIPVDNPATHLELTMVHEAMVLEYSGRHLALIEAAGMLRLFLFLNLIGSIVFPWGIASSDALPAIGLGLLTFAAKMVAGPIVLASFETSVAKMRVFRVSEFLGVALLLGLVATLFFYLAEAV